MEITQGPARRWEGSEQTRADRRAAALWSAVWEASQSFSFNEIRKTVEMALADIDSDRP